MQTLSHFTFNSDYPMDKVVYYHEFKTDTLQPNETASFDISHGLEYAPLPLVLVSTDENFQLVDQWGGNVRLYYTTADTFHVEVGNMLTSTARPLYVRLYGLAPESGVCLTAPNVRQSSKLILDSDKPYAPLIFSGVINENMDSRVVLHVNASRGFTEVTGSANRVVVEHNQGRAPFVSMWAEYIPTGKTEPIIISENPIDIRYGYPKNSYDTVNETYANLSTFRLYNTSVKHHIRIYANV